MLYPSFFCIFALNFSLITVMIEIALITLLIVVVIGIFIPVKYVPKKKRKISRSKYNDEYWTGLPWMGGAKRKRKKEYFWDD